MRLAKCLLVCAGAFLFALTAARAQSPEECNSLGTRKQFENRQDIPGCLRPITDRESLISISNLIHRLVAGELLRQPPVSPEPAGTAMISPDGDGTFTVAPAADIAQPAPQRKWNIWADGKYSWIDGNDDISGSDGPLVNAIAGIDYKITDRVILGLIGLYEHSKLDSSGAPSVSVKAQGIGGGAYLGITLTNQIVFSALVNASSFDNDYDLGFTIADTDSNRVQASSGFTGYFYSSDLWRWTPSLTAAWSGEWIDSYTDNLGNDFADQKVETAVASLGNQLGKTFSLSNGATVEPWAGAILEYTFLNRTETDNAPTLDYDDTIDIRLQAGLNFGLADNIQLALTGEMAGLLLDASDTYAGEANLAIQF
jgi:outer membrane autotransporter protein